MQRPSVNDRPTRTPLGQTGFARLSNVSRETLERLGLYVELLRAWNRRINLVGPGTMGDISRRHILDSAQLQPLLPRDGRLILDLGSGAGLPGLVLAILGVPEVHLIEADQRKAAFLREAIRVTGAPATLHAMRSEKLAPFAAGAITARAVAPLPELLDIVEPLLGAHSICLFLCGRNFEDELIRAQKAWKMKIERLPSASDPSGTILRLGSLAREP